MMKFLEKFIWLLIFTILFFLLVSACQPSVIRPTPSSQTTSIENHSALPTTSLTPSVPVNPVILEKINPLTGLEVTNPEILKRRPVMIKVSNYPALGRPHAGLAFADLVFDYFIGDGQNRFLAIFYGQDAKSIGPVRSGRLVDIQLVNLYQGILGFGSADGDTIAAIFGNLGRRAISNLEAPCPAFCGNDTHSVIGVFADSAELSKWVGQRAGNIHRYDLSGMKFTNQMESTSKPASQVNIRFNFYNRTEWQYDPASSKYMRWMNNELLTDTIIMVPSTEKTTGQQLAFTNIIILFAKYDETAPSKYNVELWGNTSGERAVFFRNGQMIEGEWKIVNRSKPVQFIDAQGNLLSLAPGNSWIVLAGLNSTFKEITPGQWDLFFTLP
jgi:hypothetical protein